MKRILLYMLLCFTLLGSGCTKEEVAIEGEGAVSFHIEVSFQTRAAYNPLDVLLIRIYKADGTLIRRYTTMEEMPRDLYLIAGDYKITVDAGDKSAATWTNKTYHGEQAFTILANQAISAKVSCYAVNVAAQVNFDPTAVTKFDKGVYAYVSASNAFQLAEINDVPTLRFDATTQTATGYFILPAGVTKLSWGFYGESTELGKISQSGVIDAVASATTYKLKFQYSKTPDGKVVITVLVDTTTEDHDDNIIFSPQPTIKGDGFDLNQTVGFNNQPLSFIVSSVKRLDQITMTANGTSTPLYNGSTAVTLPAGVTCTPIDANNMKVTLQPAFFASYTTGIHPVSFDMLDIDKGAGKGACRFAMPGLVEIAAADYDLWSNSAAFKTIVTDPAITDVKIAYRTAGGTWNSVTAVKGADCTFTATVLPTWTNATNSNSQAIYNLEKTNGIFANKSYEYKLVIGGADVGTSKSFTTTTDQTIADGSMESSALSCFTTNNGASNFWSSGNNSFADYLCKQSTYTGMDGTHTAKLTSGAPAGILAAGNLFTGLFYKDGMTTGVVEFGQPYTWKARPTALKVKYYAEKIGTVDVNKHPGAPITMGNQDKARIFVAIVDWSKRRRVASGTSAPTGIWDPEDGMNSVPEGKIIGYGSLFINQSSTGGTMIDVEIPIHFYDKTARPSGTYSLVISSSASAYGDYMVGCKSNVMHVDDFRWEY